MSLDKAIKHGKEHRKPYRGSKRFDPACRNNTCPYCLSNKLHKDRRQEQDVPEACQECGSEWDQACEPWCSDQRVVRTAMQIPNKI